MAKGNSKYAKELFTEDACLFGFLNGKFERGGIQQFYNKVDTVGAGKDFKTRIDVLLLLKINGQWKCVAKAYNQNSNTIK